MLSKSGKRAPDYRDEGCVKKCRTDVDHSEWRGSDSFRDHFENDLDDSCAAALGAGLSVSRDMELLKFPFLGTARFSKMNMAGIDGSKPETAEGNLSECYVRKNLKENLGKELSDWQKDAFGILNSYCDWFFPARTRKQSEELREVTCLHILNHALKTRRRIIQHNTKIKEAEVTAEFRDQGLVRPKILLLVPFKESALKIVQSMIRLMFGTSAENKQFVTNRKRFFSEFMPEGPPPISWAEKPEDFQSTFKGNTDDCFRVGIGIAKKSLKLFVDFYSADIILASPLGLRMIVGTEGEAKGSFTNYVTQTGAEYDFLASIEVLIIDQADVLFMQNWQQVFYVMEALNKKPREQHGTDYSRVRMWALNEWSQFYRQTVLLSNIDLPEFRSLLGTFCRNYAGCVQNQPQIPVDGCLSKIYVDLPQAFQRFRCETLSEEMDARFDFFVRRILPQYTDGSMRHTLIFVPSYFDYVRLRNHFKKRTVSFVQLCEYSKNRKISRARDLFFHGKKQFLLLSERFHFYRRNVIRGIQNLIFYQVPTYDIFYEEFCNMIKASVDSEEGLIPTCTVLFSKWDGMRLSRVVGTQKAADMIRSETSTHVIVSKKN